MRGLEIKGSKRALATTAVAVIIVIIVVAGSVGAYFALGRLSPGASTDSSTSLTTSTTSGVSSSTSSSLVTTSSTSSSVTTSTSTTNSSSSVDCGVFNANSPSGNSSSMADETTAIFGNFSSLTLKELEVNDSTVVVNATDSYSLIGRQTINGSLFYVANVTITAIESGLSGTVKYTIYSLPNGTATLVSMNGVNYTGSFAQLSSMLALLPFILVTTASSAFNQTGVTQSSYTMVNETTVTIGKVQVNQTDYQFTQSYLNEQGACNEGTYTELLMGVGNVPGTNVELALLAYEAYTLNGHSIVFRIQVTSAAKAI